MDTPNTSRQLRYLEEVRIPLHCAGVGTLPVEGDQLPVLWNGAPLCRISGRGSVLYRQENVDGIGAQDALQTVINTAAMTAEYMTAMERAPKLQATGLEGDYRILADFGSAVLAGHPTERGVQFVTWEWDFDREGVHHGHYFQDGCEEAKHDFVRRSGLLPKEALFEPEQLAEMHRALAFVCEQDEDLSIGREKEIKTIMEQIKCLLPESPEQTQTMEQSM